MSYIGPWYGPVYPRPVELTEEDKRELREERAAIEREAAKLRELHEALEGATEEVTPNEEP